MGEDPSNFAIKLETLAVKAFGNMGQIARIRLIRDRFIAGHENCDLRRYLDCVPPDTPLRDIVDRCRVWESHGTTEIRRVSKPIPEPVYPTYVVEQPDYESDYSDDESTTSMHRSECYHRLEDYYDWHYDRCQV